MGTVIATITVQGGSLNKLAQCSDLYRPTKALNCIHVLTYEGAAYLAAIDGFVMVMRAVECRGIDEIGTAILHFPADIRYNRYKPVNISINSDGSVELQQGYAKYGPFPNVEGIDPRQFIKWPAICETTPIRYNAAYFIKVLKALESRTVVMATDGPLNPIQFKDTGGNGYGIILPIRPIGETADNERRAFDMARAARDEQARAAAAGSEG